MIAETETEEVIADARDRLAIGAQDLLVAISLK